MRILLACECSNSTAKEFRKLGHYVLSCDLEPNDEDQSNHYQGDIFDVLNDNWDLMIGHPPCTFISRAGARWMYKTAGVICPTRYEQAMKAKEFFMKLWNAPIDKICLENPLPLKVVELPKESQVIQPYQFGHPFSKRTHLWLKNLPILKSTEIINEYMPYLPSNTGGKKRGQIARFKNISQKDSSKSFSGISKAMAEQWNVL